MEKCVVCGALTPLLYFDGKPLCLDCDDIRELNSGEIRKPAEREQVSSMPRSGTPATGPGLHPSLHRVSAAFHG